MKISYRQIVTFIGLAGVMACANQQVEKDLTIQAGAQPTRAMHGEVAYKGLEAIERSSSLTAEQKQKLHDLHERMMKETFRIQDETSRLKAVLFETISTSPYDPKKLGALKKSLTALNDQKMSNMFSALGEAEKIVGYIPEEEKKNVYGELLNTSPRGDIY